MSKNENSDLIAAAIETRGVTVIPIGKRTLTPSGKPKPAPKVKQAA